METLFLVTCIAYAAAICMYTIQILLTMLSSKKKKRIVSITFAIIAMSLAFGMFVLYENHELKTLLPAFFVFILVAIILTLVNYSEYKQLKTHIKALEHNCSRT